jgi:hypothetical protein
VSVNVPSVRRDLTEATLTGGSLSIVATIVMLVLLLMVRIESIGVLPDFCTSGASHAFRVRHVDPLTLPGVPKRLFYLDPNAHVIGSWFVCMGFQFAASLL